MTVLDNLKSDEIRHKYIQSFVNTGSNYYMERIAQKIEFSDGLCYTGYLWDCLINPQVISGEQIAQILEDKKSIFIMWDINSCDRIFIPNYWKYPKSSVLHVDKWLDDLRKDLPEDIYVFDDTFKWSAVYTHETDLENNPYCIYIDKGFESNRYI